MAIEGGPARMTFPDPLTPILTPDSIAVIGASEDTNKTGGRAVHYLRHFGFEGTVWPVNPNRTQIQGLEALPSVRDLPVAADLAIIAVPGDGALTAVRECAARGIRAAIVTASGFGETGQAGRAVEQAMLEAARLHGMRLVGPNSQGIAHFGAATVASFSSLFLTTAPADGPIAIVSQSGSMSVVPYCLLRDLGLGVRYSIATGNQVDLGVGDFAGAVLRDPTIRLVLLYMESIADPVPLARAARLARERDVPIVAVKAGWSKRGTTAALSHTGALVTEDRVVQAFFERHGIWRVHDADELVEAAPLYLAGWRPKGRRVMVLTDSGASAVTMADHAQSVGLEMASPSAATQTNLAKILPGFASTSNPVDMTSALRTAPGLFAQVLEQVANDGSADLYAIAFPASGAGYDVPGLARMAADFAAASNAPVALAVPQPGIARAFRDAGLPTFGGEAVLLRALAQLAAHCEMLRKKPPGESCGPPVTTSEQDGRTLSEADALGRLAAAGLPVVAHQRCADLDQAVSAARKLGPVVAMKGCSPNVRPQERASPDRALDLRPASGGRRVCPYSTTARVTRRAVRWHHRRHNAAWIRVRAGCTPRSGVRSGWFSLGRVDATSRPWTTPSCCYRRSPRRRWPKHSPDYAAPRDGRVFAVSRPPTSTPCVSWTVQLATVFADSEDLLSVDLNPGYRRPARRGRDHRRCIDGGVVTDAARTSRE